MLEALENIWGFIESIGVILSNAINTAILTVEVVVATVSMPAILITCMPSILATACIVFFAIYVLKFLIQFISVMF